MKLYNYFFAAEIDGIVSKFEATFPSEEEANRFADTMKELIVEFSFVSIVEAAFVPPF